MKLLLRGAFLFLEPSGEMPIFVYTYKGEGHLYLIGFEPAVVLKRPKDHGNFESPSLGARFERGSRSFRKDHGHLK